MERCWPRLDVDVDVRERYRRALDGDDEGLRDLVATALACQYELHAKTGAELLRDGMTVEHLMVTPDGEVVRNDDGPVVVKVTRHPAVDPWLRQSEVLGITARDQALTPASRSEQRRDDGIGSLAAFMTAARRRATEGDS